MNINNDSNNNELTKIINDETIIEQFSHILAHQLKNNDSDSFNYIYDQIPKDLDLNKVSKYVIIFKQEI